MSTKDRWDFVKRELQEYLQALLGLVYPSACRLCGEELPTEDTLVCNNCWREVARYNWIISEKVVVVHNVPIYGTFSLSAHKDKAQELVHLIKYNDLSILVGRWIKRAKDRLEPMRGWLLDVVVPIPLHHTRRRERGYDQALIISSHLAKVLGVPIGSALLKRIRSTKPMIEVSAEERLDNVKDAFLCRSGDGLMGKRILLVDDVYTTGATTSQSAKALYAGGAERVFVFTLTKAGGEVS